MNTTSEILVWNQPARHVQDMLDFIGKTDVFKSTISEPDQDWNPDPALTTHPVEKGQGVMANSHDTSTREDWKAIPGFVGSFEASTHGRIKALRRHAGTRWYDERIMHPSQPERYLKVNLSFLGRVHQRKVHQLILETFVGPCPEGLECLHNDGNKLNNHLSNLAWGTAKENGEDRVRHGRIRSGERHHNAKLTKSKVEEARAMHANGTPGTKIANTLSVGLSAIYSMLNGKTWRRV